MAEFAVPVNAADLDRPNAMLRMGMKPMMLELMNEISGVGFEQAWANRVMLSLDDLNVPMISLADLRVNKKSAGLYKDLADLTELPEE